MSKFFACKIDLGYPSKIILFLNFSLEINLSANLLTILSETSNPELIVEDILIPSSVLSFIDYRILSLLVATAFASKQIKTSL